MPSAKQEKITMTLASLPRRSSLGLEGSGPLQQDTQGPRDLALAFLTASLFVMSPFGNTCF